MKELEREGMRFVGQDENAERMEIMELKGLLLGLAVRVCLI